MITKIIQNYYSRKQPTPNHEYSILMVTRFNIIVVYYLDF